jgi:hypothetical protein
MRLQLQRYLLSCKVRCRRATHFLESRTCRLAQAVYGKCSLVLPSRCNLSIVCLTLVRTIAVVALTRPPCHRLRRSPKSSRSTAHANVACARWLQGRRGALEAARQSLGASQLRMLGKCRRDTHGDHAIALREVIFAYPLPQVRLLMLLLIGGYLARKIGAVSRVSVRFLTVDSPSRAKYAAGPSTTSYGLDNLQRVVERLLRRAPSSTARGHCRLTPLSRRCRALW